jgi:hypothetical protein
MKNTIKVSKIPMIGLAVLIAAIVFSIAACDDSPGEELPELSGDITIAPSGTVAFGTQLVATYSGSETVRFSWYKDGKDLNVHSDRIKASSAGSYKVLVYAEGFQVKTSNTVIVSAKAQVAPDELNDTTWSYKQTTGGTEYTYYLKFNTPDFTWSTVNPDGTLVQNSLYEGTYSISGNTVTLTVEGISFGTAIISEDKDTLSWTLGNSTDVYTKVE